MQAVILAAGASTRTYPLTLTKPKPLLKVANKALLEHNLDNLKGLVDEIILVVGYKKDMIKDFLTDKYENLKIKFVHQQEQLGTGHALLSAEKYIENEFILLFADDLYSKEDIKKLLKNKYSILTKEVENPELFGVVKENNGILLDIIEKPQMHISNLISTGLYKFDKKIFPLLKKVKKSERKEYEMTDAIRELAIVENIHCVQGRQWLPIGYPWDLLKADKILRGRKNLIGEKTKIEGKVENSSIGNNCIIKGKVRNSIIMDDSIVDEDSVVEDSVIGENVYFKGKVKSDKNIKSLVKGKPVLVEKLGTIIADNVVAKGVDIKPGCKIWPNKKISGKIGNDIT